MEFILEKFQKKEWSMAKESYFISMEGLMKVTFQMISSMEKDLSSCQMDQNIQEIFKKV